MRVPGMRRGLCWAVVMLLGVAGCARSSTTGEANEAAEQAYVACAEELGVEVIEVWLPADDIEVQLSEGCT